MLQSNLGWAWPPATRHLEAAGHHKIEWRIYFTILILIWLTENNIGLSSDQEDPEDLCDPTTCEDQEDGKICLMMSGPHKRRWLVAILVLILTHCRLQSHGPHQTSPHRLRYQLQAGL